MDEYIGWNINSWGNGLSGGIAGGGDDWHPNVTGSAGWGVGYGCGYVMESDPWACFDIGADNSIGEPPHSLRIKCFK